MIRATAWVLLAAACDATTSTQSSAIVGGSADTGDPAVVAIVARRTQCNQASIGVQCTGTVVADRVVLTAAHCVVPDATGTYEVYMGPSVGDPSGRFILVDDAVRHPQFDDATHAYDFALVHLADSAQVPPVALPSVTLDSTYVNAQARIVGYGVAAPMMIADGIKRDTTMLVSAVDAQTFTATPNPGNSCGGDSGGPVFVQTGSGEQLLGVTSSGDAQCATNAIDARVDTALGFIQTYLASPPTFPPPTIDPADTCTATCTKAADCPAQMTCEVGRCRFPGSLPASYHAACTQDSECGTGTCAQLTPDDCRCTMPCASMGGPGTPGGHDSCNVGGGGSWLSLLALAFTVRRSRRRMRA